MDIQTLLMQNGQVNNARRTADEMDEERQKLLAYEYLCHLEEVKKWLEACLREKLPPTTELEENLRNGVYLAKLAHFMSPNSLPLHKIYDLEQKRYMAAGLQFRHTDNINHFLRCLKEIQLPLTFQPETTDIYDKKNMPRVIYCIHALSTHLFKYGKAPQIQDLYGKVNFTDDEIGAVSKELQKYGVQMPQFQKIGDLLTSSMSGDKNSLHAAVMEINVAVEEQDCLHFLEALNNTSAQLHDVLPKYTEDYYNALLKAKQTKAQALLNRSLNDSYIPDVYDEMVTQAEIQGHINCINAQHALQDIFKSIKTDEKTIIKALRVPTLSLQEVISENVSFYKEELLSHLECHQIHDDNAESNHYWVNLFQNIINIANESANKHKKRKETARLLNMTLHTESKNEFCKILTNPELGISDYVDEFALHLYYEEMKIDRIESQNDLSYDDILISLRVLNTIANITKAIDTGNPELAYEALRNPDAHVTGLYEEHKTKYFRALETIRYEKQKNAEECMVLTYIDIQECIDLVNQQCQTDIETIEALRRLNVAVMKNDRSGLLSVLKDDALKLKNPIPLENASLYLKLFKKCLEEQHSDGSELWLEDVERINNLVVKHAEEVQKICLLLGEVNNGLEKNKMSNTIDAIRSMGYDVPTLKSGKSLYEELQKLYKLKKEKYTYPYIQYVSTQNIKSFLDLKTSSYTWDCPRNVTESFFITKEDIAKMIQREIVLKSQNCIVKINTDMVLRLQAYIRGYLLRKAISDRFTHYYNNLQKIIKIQAWWRSIIQQRKFMKLVDNERMKHFNNKSSKSFKKDNSENVLEYYREYEDEIIKIQTLWRGRMARRAFNSLLRSEKPPFAVVKYFSGILNFNAEDYDKDLQLQHLKHEVVQSIRYNQNLSQQLDSMDVKIGLLIQNRITLHDVAVHGKSLETLAKQKEVHKDGRNAVTENFMPHKGLKSLTKEGRKMLESYQHLFYALQTSPIYLSKLLFLLPQSRTNKFLQNVILTLFNFGSNIREEYLLLKLFASALQEEIRCKFQKPAEIVTGNPLVLKMVINYARQLNGQKALRQIVGPIIETVLADRTLSIETNPVDIYKCWRNQLETETGEALNLPYTVTPQQALNYVQVRKRLNKGIELLQNTVLEFLNKICESRDLIPYGMLYVAKVLHDSVAQKFPNSPEKDILKVVGNLIYYHFINAAIVAPDAFDIITLPIDKSLSNDQRRNLASIAKILQFAASKKGFGEEAAHLVCLNPFIIECHEKFKNFFRHCCQIEDLEDHFAIHEYTEATLIHKPEIYISLQEICDTHCLLLEYQNQIAPDPMDVLHDLLEDLGPAPTVGKLLGISDSICETNIIRFGKTEVCLILTNKFEVPEKEDTNLYKLFIKTKELLVSVLQFLKGQTLVAALESSCSPVQERLYDAKCSSIMNTINVIQRSSSLNDCKHQLRAYLNKLELGGWVSQKDGYQTIVTAVAKDLCNKGKYRQIRNKELQTLKVTKERLEEKTKYYQEQVEFYNEYIKRCRENLHAGKGSYRGIKTLGRNNHNKLTSKNTLKYSAAKLQEKGILIEVDGLSNSQLKNVVFEISPTEHSGIFSVRCKFMGVEMEKVEIDIQKLLELQFEGSPIIDMFGKVKINVNLLLYLLNRKFYGKN
ncbi:ras GTPase-activating-like protein IQGAP1 [Prorops nasuta]|uniref:ras GTPase-activating-like protein IQGAP1 n=1 Tax=Prorops nasuta TaxID=863751 RepID=UPI0034CD062A